VQVQSSAARERRYRIALEEAPPGSRLGVATGAYVTQAHVQPALYDTEQRLLRGARVRRDASVDPPRSAVRRLLESRFVHLCPSQQKKQLSGCTDGKCGVAVATPQAR
jgi:hypothetical protein